MTQDTIAQAVSAAEAVADSARDLRHELRWTTPTDDPDRRDRIEAKLTEINAAMQPIRSWVGRLVWDPQPEATEDAIRDASTALQYERKQLKKMRR